MNTIIKILPWAAVAILLFLLFLGRGCNPKPEKTTVISYDTVYITDTKTVFVNVPTLVKAEPKPIPPVYQPSDDCDSLKGQYNYLAASYFAKNLYRDTIRKDSSYVVAECVVTGNGLSECNYFFNLKYPVVTKTIDNTITLPPRRQLYIGGGVGTDFKLDRLYLQGGFMYKNRKDNMFGGEVMLSNQGDFIGSVKTYFKIDLRRKP